MSADRPLVINGWEIYAHPLFLDQLEQLTEKVEELRLKKPEDYKKKNPTKRLAAITQLAFDDIPQNPTREKYRQGGTLGNEHKHWFRAKFYQQYRLFFRYHLESRIIIYAWVNDTNSKRSYDSSTDAYKVFQKMLEKGYPPDDWDKLVEQAKAEQARLQEAAKTKKDLMY